MAAQQYATDQEGNRVISASRRPDGTLRKEIRVRQGYIPQDEQARFTTQGARGRQGVQIIPGLDNAELNGAQQSSAAANTNQRRRPKKAASSRNAAAPVEQLAGLHLNAAPRSDKADSIPPASAGQASDAMPAEGAVLLDKAIKGLRKKLTACDALAKRQQAGDKMTGPELDKLSKVPAWQAEVAELEHQLHQAQ